jgi:hypothetical protein
MIIHIFSEQRECFSLHAPLFPDRGKYFPTQTTISLHNYFPTQVTISLHAPLFPDKGNYFLTEAIISCQAAELALRHCYITT